MPGRVTPNLQDRPQSDRYSQHRADIAGFPRRVSQAHYAPWARDGSHFPRTSAVIRSTGRMVCQNSSFFLGPSRPVGPVGHPRKRRGRMRGTAPVRARQHRGFLCISPEEKKGYVSGRPLFPPPRGGRRGVAGIGDQGGQGAGQEGGANRDPTRSATLDQLFDDVRPPGFHVTGGVSQIEQSGDGKTDAPRGRDVRGRSARRGTPARRAARTGSRVRVGPTRRSGAGNSKRSPGGTLRPVSGGS